MSKLSLSPTQLQQLLEIAKVAAAKAAALINESFEIRYDSPLEIESKSSSADLVTQYDKQCEEIVLQEITEQCALWVAGKHSTQAGTDAEGKQQFYGDGTTPFTYEIVSEETRHDIPLHDLATWIVDPIDGTTAFVHGGFDCCVSIGMALNRIPIIGVVDCPRLNEIYTGITGQGSFCNGHHLQVSPCTSMNRALISTHTSYNRSHEAIEAITNINRKLARDYKVHGIRSYGAAAMDMCSVAKGRLDMYFEVGIQAWDMCAGIVMIREAGGIVSSIDKLDYDVEKKESQPEGFDLMSQAMCCGSSWQLVKEGIATSVEFNYRNAILFTK
eukprot:GILI01012579.1.p1 GENE.GILI01012579.1~~GILI01012579.1.p1  ORF type:complete len:329 (+),score=93.06 GILI01012579.1:59-1045(+)